MAINDPVSMSYLFTYIIFSQYYLECEVVCFWPYKKYVHCPIVLLYV